MWQLAVGNIAAAPAHVEQQESRPGFARTYEEPKMRGRRVLESAVKPTGILPRHRHMWSNEVGRVSPAHTREADGWVGISHRAGENIAAAPADESRNRR
jgi:hypothetical protein